MHAMLLAAGLGERMRPLTEQIPKPLISIAGVPMIDRMLDHLKEGGVEYVVVNTHHLAEQVAAHLRPRRTPSISIVHEKELLDTGGGVAEALPLLGGSPFLVSNSDIIMLNGVQPFVQRLMETWRPYMSALLLIHPTVHAPYYSGLGDFILGSDGKMRRRVEREIAPYLFTGVQILHKRLFDRCPAPPFSLNVLYDRAETAGRLYGVVHDGEWMHVGTVDAITRIEGRLKLLI
ncbi:MAG: D-glycero-alpha-D-manno-heptose 1-phosphate guanylyltransferase [Alphaproteobacteria bacterium MarineAlpha9_Bin7]|nr:MAG: D-glycero-alpha-D-manno-heptose 1-phosphate guanylyltransferase [Alphaproteobacteria bacterium MarineAlpha9_Bin7]